MTTAEIHEMEKLDQTCDEVRREAAALRDEVASMRFVLGEVYKANSLGKTRKIALMIEEALYPNRYSK